MRRSALLPTQLLPVGFLLAAMVSVQCGAALAMRLFTRIGPTATVMLRLCIAAMFMAVAIKPSFAALSRGRWRPVVGLGLSVGSMNWLFYESISRIPLGTTVTLEFLGPLALALATSRRLTDAGWTLLAAIGVLLLGGTDGWTLGLGGVFALIAGGCWAAYIMLNQRVGRLFSDAVGLTFSMGIAGIIMVPGGVAAGGSRTASMTVVGVGAIVAVLSSVIPYMLDMAALRRISPRFYATFYSLEPAVAAVVGMIFLGQSVGLRGAMAILLVATASIGVSWQLRKPPITVREP